MQRMPDDKVIWVGVYHIDDDSFTVWRGLERDKSGKAIVRFTDKESTAIENASEGRCFFKWNPPDSDLTSGSRADWARM